MSDLVDRLSHWGIVGVAYLFLKDKDLDVRQYLTLGSGGSNVVDPKEILPSRIGAWFDEVARKVADMKRWDKETMLREADSVSASWLRQLASQFRHALAEAL